MKKLAFLISEIDKSKELIRFAALLGKEINAMVHVVYVQSPQLYGAQGYKGATGSVLLPEMVHFQKYFDEIKDKISGFCKEIEAELTGVSSIIFKSEIGDAAAIINEKVVNKEYDMVMLQGQNEQGLGLQNSVIMDVVRNVPCPVFIIPPEAKFKPMKKIIYATDYNEEDIDTLKSLLETTKYFDPEILALHISNDDKFEKKLKSQGFASMISEKTAYSKITVKMIADKDGKDAVEILVGEAENTKANLIVVLKENRNFFERLFQSSFTSELVKKSHMPIMIFHK